MTKIFHPLLALIASASDKELAKYVQFLKEENKILRSRVDGQIHTKPEERERLLDLGKELGRAIEELITIVSPKTFYRWIRERDGRKRKSNPKGGQRKPREIRELVIQIATTTNFGYTRILGELRKLGIKKISRQTIRNILKEEGIAPGPDRTSDSWTNFVERHKETLWACDFFSVKTVTTRGMSWMKRMALNLTDHEDGFLNGKKYLLMDRDAKFCQSFRDVLKNEGVDSVRLPVRSPNMNAFVERFMRSLKFECLNRMIFFGEASLQRSVKVYLEHYHAERNHQGVCNQLINPEDGVGTVAGKIECRERLGGMLKYYHRAA